MKLQLVLFSTACLYFMAPVASINLLAAAAASKGVVIETLPGASVGQPVVQLIHAKPPQQVVLEHKPVTLVPVATIPSHSFTDKLTKLWSGISDSIGTKIRAVGDFLRGPPKVVLISVDKSTTTKKPHPPPVTLEVVEVPHHRVYPLPGPVVVNDCGNRISCFY